MAIILFFIIILNAVAIALTYYCLDSMEKKERTIFVAVGVAVMYIVTSFVYWLSTKGVEVKEVSEAGKNMITFLFVPVNSIIILPILAKSYNKYKMGSLKADKFRNRCILLIVILLIVLRIECSYFKDIQNGIIHMMQNNAKDTINSVEEDTTNVLTNTIVNELLNGNITKNNSIVNNNVNNNEQ